MCAVAPTPVTCDRCGEKISRVTYHYCRPYHEEMYKTCMYTQFVLDGQNPESAMLLAAAAVDMINKHKLPFPAFEVRG